MTCERIQETFLDYHAGTLSDTDAARVREHIKTCLSCQRVWADLQQTVLTLDRLPEPTPTPRLRANVYAMIEEARQEIEAPNPFALARSRIDGFFAALLPHRPTLQFALTVTVLIAGVLVGSRLLGPDPVVISQPDPDVQRELAALRTQVESIDKLMAANLRQQSAASRLQDVLAAAGSTGTDEQALAGLLNTLAFDPNVNVRLGALEALYAHANRDPVRAAIAAALPRERSPLVQVAMIDFIVATGDASTIPTLSALARDEQVDAVVREAAQRGVAQL